MADPSKIGQAFLQEYYGRLDSNRRTTMHELYVRNQYIFFLFEPRLVKSTFSKTFFFLTAQYCGHEFRGNTVSG